LTPHREPQLIEDSNLLRNGDFATDQYWSLGENCRYTISADGTAELHTRGADPVQKQLNGEGEHAGAACQYCLLPDSAVDLHAGGEIAIRWLTPYTGKGNMAHLSAADAPWVYVALEQHDWGGDVVQRDDYRSTSADDEWQTFAIHAKRHPAAAFIALSAGVYNGTGDVRFRSFFTVAYDRERRAISAPPVAATPSTPRAAIFADRAFPDAPSTAAIERLDAALRAASFVTERLTAAELSDPAIFSRARFDLLVLTHGASFPATAREPLLRFLVARGHLLSLGGYCFGRVLYRDRAGAWQSEEALIASALAAQPSVLPPFEAWNATGDVATANGAAHLRNRFDRGGPPARLAASARLEPGCWYAVHAHGAVSDMPYPWQPMLTVDQHDAAGRTTMSWSVSLLEHQGMSEGTFSYVFKTAYDQAATDFIVTGGSEGGDLSLSMFSVVPVPELVHLNTDFGRAHDLILTKPPQLGIFDADFPLKRATTLALAPDQEWLDDAGAWTVRATETPLTGWATTGQTRNDDARWVPLLETFDRYGRERGPAAAVLFNYAGFFSHSTWVCFGVPADMVLHETRVASVARLAKRICCDSYLRNLETTVDLVEPGEDVTLRFIVQNPVAMSRQADIEVDIRTEDGQVIQRENVQLTLPPNAPVSHELAFAGLHLPSTFYRIGARLEPDGDVMESGFAVGHAEARRGGPDVQLDANIYTLDRRPAIVFGADNYQNVFFSSFETPLMQRKMMSVSRDFQMRIYENLQYIPDRFEFDLRQQRALECVVQQSQEFKLIYMPCLLVLTNVLVGEEGTAQQADFVRGQAEWLKDVRGLIYYFNGDLGSTIPARDEYVERWARYLQTTYDDIGRLAETWGAAYQADAGWEQPFHTGPDPVWLNRATMTGRKDARAWHDLHLRDRVRFLPRLCRNWNDTLHAVVREVDQIHPTTDEFSDWPHAANDIQQAIGDLTLANATAFGPPGKDIDYLPGKLSIADLRSRGKGAGLGEYGCKTHPGQRWSPPSYLLQRTDAEQNLHFLAVQHYALGRGAGRLQHWCLRDGTEWIFPWGMFYPNGMVPKDIAYEVRNASLLFNQFSRVEREPEIVLLLPDSHRLGPFGGEVTAAIHSAANALTALQRDYYVIGEDDLAALSFTPKVIFWPVPYCPADETVAWIEGFVQHGGRLYLSGDLSYDAFRRPTREARLECLLDVMNVEPRFIPPEWSWIDTEPVAPPVNPSLASWAEAAVRPGVRFSPHSADVLISNNQGAPVIVEARNGRGSVVFNSDPTEMTTPVWRHNPALVDLYRHVVDQALPGQMPVTPAGPELHVMRPSVTDGDVYVIFNRGERRAVHLDAADLSLVLDHRYPGLVHIGPDGECVTIEAQGTVARNGTRLVEMNGHFAIVALDREDISASRALLVIPFSPGNCSLFTNYDPRCMEIEAGEFRDGAWLPFERRRVHGDRVTLTIDPTGATLLYLIAVPVELDTWRRRLSHFAKHGYVDNA
jgi:hypothetical protein